MNARVELQPEAYGVFRLAGMELALPLATMRELMPLAPLTPLPCATPGVLGGLNVRGVLVPVLDLRGVLAWPPEGQPAAVVILAHQGRVLGLLAEGGTGVFAPSAEAMVWMKQAQGTGMLMRGAFPRPDQQGMVSLLDPEALMNLPGVPVALEREGGLGVGAEIQAALGMGAPEDEPLVLVLAGGIPFAISSAAVHTTLLKPDVRESALTGGYCLGVLIHDGLRIPAVDLLALCGLGQLPRGVPQQAFLLRYAQGLVAFVVTEIVDVARADQSRVVPLPERAFRVPGLLLGALPAAACLTQVRASATGAFAHFLLVAAEALLNHTDLIGMAGINMPAEVGHGDAHQQGQRRDEAYAEHCQVLVYSVGYEVVTPVEQIIEILPWRPDEAVRGHGGQVVGVVVSRGRAVTLYSLQALLGLAETPPSDSASVLVLAHGETHVGYVVPALVSIDDAPRPRAGRVRRGDSLASHLGACSPVLVGERLLGVLDLQALTLDLLGAAVAPQPALPLNTSQPQQGHPVGRMPA
ncbi:chemotaxis protein CheW [Zoogloea sp.]|uniref:chemotaxis protein CheW n=1 Tax=Zoogloea sp. TaxID=49181 RepID=UPI0035B45897